MKTYKVIFNNDRGGFNSSALAASVGGSSYNNVDSYDGKHDLAFIDVDDDFASYLEELMADDENIVSWEVV